MRNFTMYLWQVVRTLGLSMSYTLILITVKNLILNEAWLMMPFPEFLMLWAVVYVLTFYFEGNKDE